MKKIPPAFTNSMFLVYFLLRVVFLLLRTLSDLFYEEKKYIFIFYRLKSWQINAFCKVRVTIER
jgi:hypothetical protein